MDVRGKILSDSQVESWVGKFVGIVTAGAVGVTTLTYSVGTGSSTKLGRANAEELNVTAGFQQFSQHVCNRYYCFNWFNIQ